MNKEQLQQHIIDNIFPKEIKNESFMFDVERGHNICLEEVKALLPEIIEYILKNKDV